MATLQELLAEARAAGGLDRLTFRDVIAEHGAAAIEALAPWLAEAPLASFAIRTIEKAAAVDADAKAAAIDALREHVPSLSRVSDIREGQAAIARLQTAGRPRVEVREGEGGATIVGHPVDGAHYSPPLSDAERTLIDVLQIGLAEGWFIFIRPHLDGDRPAVALLHPEYGAMLWDIRTEDLADVTGLPKDYVGADGEPFMDPLARVSAMRRRLYTDYLPAWGEAIDLQPKRFGAVSVGVYFPNASNANIRRLSLFNRVEIVVGREGIRSRAIQDLVPNASRNYGFSPKWHTILYRRFSDYHPPSLSAIKLSKSQRERVDEPVLLGWRGLEGVAGAGKSTVLAHRAARLAQEGYRVLLVTYNLTLANYCRGLVDDTPHGFEWSNLVVQHFHGICHVVLRRFDERAPLHPDGRDQDEFGQQSAATGTGQGSASQGDRDLHYDVAWPQRVQDVLGLHGLPADLAFDAILVDEAQDFGAGFFDVLDKLLRPRGEILLAFDRAQRLYARKDGLDQRLNMSRVRGLGGTHRLQQRQAEIASALGASLKMPTKRIELDAGVEPFFSDEDAMWAAVPDAATAVATAAEMLVRWQRGDGYRPDGTVVLVPSRRLGDALVGLLERMGMQTNNIFPTGGDMRRAKQSFDPLDQRVRVATIHSYKGWESTDVIVVEPPSGDERAAAAFYVALTRSKSRLVVIASEDPYSLRSKFDAYTIEPNATLVSWARSLVGRQTASASRGMTALD